MDRQGLPWWCFVAVVLSCLHEERKGAAEVFTRLSSCKGKFQQITSVGQWSLGQMCGCPAVVLGTQSCSPSKHLHGAQVSVSLLLSAGALALQPLPPCLGFVQCVSLTINNIFPPLSTLHYHTTNLESVGGADFPHFSTQRMCSLLLNCPQ